LIVTAQVASALTFLLGIMFGYAMRQFDEQPLVLRKINKTMEKPVLEPVLVDELVETEKFLAFLHDDTSDDIRLKRYKPVKLRNRAPLAITALPHPTTANMQRIRLYMLEHGPNAQHTKVLNGVRNEE
jgi:hypothetical protein